MNETIQPQVVKAIAEGRRVQQAVQQIMVKSLAQGRLNLEEMRTVTGDAVAAMREAATRQDTHAANAVKDAARGIECALAQAAQALKLSIQEASGRAGKFASEDLAKARADMVAVEKMFVDTLTEAGEAARGAARTTLQDLARHAGASGTAIGRQLCEAADSAGEAAAAARKEFDAGLETAASSAAVFTRAAAGVLSAISDTLRPADGKRPGT